ncbi:MAG: dockerin type I repeat-containing protein [Ruminococcus sp.]|nr:dockerin type I repeat-containing protein [Ruminococcus sp.]
MKAKRLVSAVLATAMAFSCAVSASANSIDRTGEVGYYPIRYQGMTIGTRTYIRGDVNGDWEINVTDISLVASFVAGKTNIYNHEGWYYRADCNCDGVVDEKDVKLIANYVKGISKY